MTQLATPVASHERRPARGTLLRSRRQWFNGERWARWFFQGNATISLLVLALITLTLFRDAVGFIPQNRDNLQIYRQAGLEFVDVLRGQVNDHREMTRVLSSVRIAEFTRLTAKGELSLADANAALALFDRFADQFADSMAEQETLVGEMSEQASSLKERYRVAEDLREARQHLLDGIPSAPPERAAQLRQEAEAMRIETINFATEIEPLRQRLPEVRATNAALSATMRELAARAPRFTDTTAQEHMREFQRQVGEFLQAMPGRAAQMEAWDPARPIAWWESLHAFAFGRQWVTASFWQDWYGVLPLFTGSLLIAVLALSLAIPLGVAAAIYVNQVATPLEQRVIKPYIEFIAAIPSVVLGFFGIAVLGETLRRVSQVPWLDWVPGFPMLERLNAATAACLLALMAVPTIFTLAEDAINNVPRAFKEASLALGATRLQTVMRIVIPAALSGIMAAVLLGFGRVIGETMVVLLCAGNRIAIPDLAQGLGTIFQPVHTMTGIIAQEMGEVVRGSIHYRALFMVGAVLFLISLMINWLAQKIVRRYRLPAI